MEKNVKPVFPQELFDSIVDEFRPRGDDSAVRDFRRTLQSCALVCNSFRLRAHRHLFERVGFGSVPEHISKTSIARQIKGIQLLYPLLKADSYLTSCIRSLTINIHHGATVTEPHVLLAEVLEILYESMLQSQGLVELILLSGVPGSDSMPWQHISMPTQISLLQLIHGPKTTLEELSLKNFTGLPLDMFARCKTVKTLLLTHVGIEGPVADETQAVAASLSQNRLHSLRELVWVNEQPLDKFLRDLSTVLSIEALTCGLQILRILGSVPVGGGILKQILEWSADSLRDLTICLGQPTSKLDNEAQFLGVLDLSQCPRLYSLYVHCRSYARTTFTSISPIIDIFTHSASIRPLSPRVLIISVSVITRDEVHQCDIFDTRNRWDELEKLLIGPSFVALQEVQLHLHFSIVPRLLVERPGLKQEMKYDATRFFSTSFSALQSSKTITFRTLCQFR